MAKRTIGKPRFYADLGQYLKAKGYYSGNWNNGIESVGTDLSITV